MNFSKFKKTKILSFFLFLILFSSTILAQEDPELSLDVDLLADYDDPRYGEVDINNIIASISDEIKLQGFFSKRTFEFLLNPVSSQESSFLRARLLPYIMELNDLKERKTYINFLSNVFSEIEVSIQSLENRNSEKAAYYEQEYKTAELKFIEMTNEYFVKGLPKKTFHPNGSLAKEVFYNNNGQVIKIDEYYPEGAIKKQILYSRSNGDVIMNIEEYYENGQIKKKGSYLGSQKHGKFFEYDQSTGKILREENYVNGNKEGTFKKYNQGGNVLRNETKFVNNLRVEEINYRPDGNIERILTYNNHGDLLLIEAFGKNNIRTTLTNYSDQTVIKYDPITGDVILVANFDPSKNAWVSGEMFLSHQSIKAQMMLMLSFSTDFKYKEISSLSNSQLSEEVVLSVLKSILGKESDSQEYKLALSLIVMPGFLDFIDATAENSILIETVDLFTPIADLYNEQRYVRTDISNPSLVNIKFTEVQKTRMLDMYRTINRSHKNIRIK
jgi:antitoxin component YwqK of YwqJK toxin-antitoxin module